MTSSASSRTGTTALTVSGILSREHQAGAEGEAEQRQQGAGTADPDGEGALARAAVGLDVAHVVDDQDRRDQAADREREPEREPVEAFELDEVGAVDRDQPEEEED